MLGPFLSKIFHDGLSDAFSQLCLDLYNEDNLALSVQIENQHDFCLQLSSPVLKMFVFLQAEACRES